MHRAAEFKEKNAALLHNLLPSDEKEALVNHNVVNVFTHRDHKNRRVLLVNCGKLWDPSKVSADQLFRIFYIIHKLAAQEPETQVVTNCYIVCHRMIMKNCPNQLTIQIVYRFAAKSIRKKRELIMCTVKLILTKVYTCNLIFV